MVSGTKSSFGDLSRRVTVPLMVSLLISCGGGGSGNSVTESGSGVGSSKAVNSGANSSNEVSAEGTAIPASGSNTAPLQNTLSLTQKNSFTGDDIRHFLARTHFSVEPGRTETIEQLGLSVYIDQMLDFPELGSQPYEADARQLLFNDDDPAGLEGMFPSNSDVLDWNIHLLMNNPNAFQEVLGMFWQDRFGVNSETFRNEEDHLMIDYVNMLRDKGAGSYRNLLVDVSRHGAMLIFLDGADNSKFAPNENYAREFWELFSLGVDNGYTENDVIEGARAFTGWKRQVDAATGLTHVVFDPESKAVGSKQPLGNNVNHNLGTDDYAVMVDLTLSHTDATEANLVAEYLSEKLLKYFYSDNPSPALVAGFAGVLRQNNLEVGLSLKTLFLSQAFYGSEGRQGMVRDFYEQAVGLVRTTGLTESNNHYRNYLFNMNSLPSRPPSVEGWPEGDDKISSQATGVEMPNFVNELITNRNAQEEQGYDIGAALQPEGARSADDVVDHLAMLLGVTLDDTERSSIIDYMNVEISGDGEETPLFYTPQNVAHQNRKLRNLLWILTQHPSFHTK